MQINGLISGETEKVQDTSPMFEGCFNLAKIGRIHKLICAKKTTVQMEDSIHSSRSDSTIARF